jgi:hypothetical protein
MRCVFIHRAGSRLTLTKRAPISKHGGNGNGPPADALVPLQLCVTTVAQSTAIRTSADNAATMNAAQLQIVFSDTPVETVNLFVTNSVVATLGRKWAARRESPKNAKAWGLKSYAGRNIYGVRWTYRLHFVSAARRNIRKTINRAIASISRRCQYGARDER